MLFVQVYQWLVPALPSDSAEGIPESPTFTIAKEHPLVGRPAQHACREFLISRGRTGCVALCKYDVERDMAIVFVVRRQHESGFHG